AQPATVVAVTGTSGKTSVASFARQIWATLGRKAASLGTLGLIAPNRARYGSLTTPDPAALHKDLAELAADGVTCVAMEASSHGLDQCRLDGVKLQAAAFTNLSRDHLDYHADMDAYFAAKRRLFDTLLPRGSVAVLNADIPEYAALAAACETRGLRVASYGRNGKHLRLIAATPVPGGQDVEIEAYGATHRFLLPLAGAFQTMNALAAAGLVVGAGAAPMDAIEALAKLEGVPGRMERVGARKNGAAVYVDYAHKPDALASVLAALRPHVTGKLHVVFGCGGDRDPGKRPMMGKIAVEGADRAIVTDDNPRTEDAASIRAAVLAAAPGAIEIAPREIAIRDAVAALEAGDVLAICGKGHETGQIVGSETLPFDDRIEARKAIALADGDAA
ncbi:MAG: UDP-N-acetylmuramoyl-L-alanyl-D-glutamate--2,6-diaminopimelate ligase, partial [Tagaea sp.]|nr:UDP-N-acetylmuramoyl-L-alanyl-D-glutamate--2,6-diaminopimelate ligase [Tagaea sp.]